jgi:hypothetical protein
MRVGGGRREGKRLEGGGGEEMMIKLNFDIGGRRDGKENGQTII